MTPVENAYEELLVYQHTAPQSDEGAAKWIEKHNLIEEEISRSGAETLGDVVIKLDILCGRLEQAHVDHGDLVIAQSMRSDLKRLMVRTA